MCVPRNSFEKLISDEALGIAVTDYAPYVGEPMHVRIRRKHPVNKRHLKVFDS